MKRLVVYCEGQTEEMVVNRLLRPWLEASGIRVERPVLAATSLDPAGQRGGFVNWPAIEFDLRQLFAADADPGLRFTTFLDCYAMPAQVLELAGFAAPATAAAEIAAVERALEDHFGEPRFKAYLQRHELEALLLADCTALGRVFPRCAASPATRTSRRPTPTSSWPKPGLKRSAPVVPASRPGCGTGRSGACGKTPGPADHSLFLRRTQ